MGWRNVPPLIWGCHAAFDLYALALHVDPGTTRRPPPFEALPRVLVWLSLQAFL
jgi:hypothetical protein